MTTQESNTITCAKAIAIILMVLGHTSLPSAWIVRIIYTFHIPLFFILSGYCFKSKYLDDAWTFFKRKFVGIYVPFVEASLIFLLLHNVFYELHIYDGNYGYGEWTSHVYTVKEMLIHAKHVVLGMRTEEDLLGGFWFLKELFWGNIIFYILFRLFRREWIVLLVTLCVTHLLRFTLWTIPIVEVNWMAFYSASFIASGYCLKQYKLYWWKSWIWIPCVCLLICGISFSINYYQGMPMQHTSSLLPYYIFAVGSTMFVCLLVGVYNNSELPPPTIAFGPIRGTTHVYYTYLAFSRVQVGFTANSVYL